MQVPITYVNNVVKLLEKQGFDLSKVYKKFPELLHRGKLKKQLIEWDELTSFYQRIGETLHLTSDDWVGLGTEMVPKKTFFITGKFLAHVIDIKTVYLFTLKRYYPAILKEMNFIVRSQDYSIKIDIQIPKNEKGSLESFWMIQGFLEVFPSVFELPIARIKKNILIKRAEFEVYPPTPKSPIYRLKKLFTSGRIVGSYWQYLSEVQQELNLTNGQIEELFSEYTDTKKFLEKIKEEEKRYHNIFESTHDSILVLMPVNSGEGFEIVDINQNAMGNLQVPKEQLLNKDLLEIIPFLKDSEFALAMKRVWQTGVSEQQDLQFPVDDILLPSFSEGRAQYSGNIHRLSSSELILIYHSEVVSPTDSLQSTRLDEQQTIHKILNIPFSQRSTNEIFEEALKYALEPLFLHWNHKEAFLFTFNEKKSELELQGKICSSKIGHIVSNVDGLIHHECVKKAIAGNVQHISAETCCSQKIAIKNLSYDSAMKAYILPMIHEGKTTGIIFIFYSSEKSNEQRNLNYLETLSKTFTLLLEKSKLNCEIQKLSKLLFITQEEENKKIARELHDVVAQELLSGKIYLDQMLSGNDIGNKKTITSISTKLQETLVSLRTIIENLRPAKVEHFPLSVVLNKLIKNYNQEQGAVINFSAVGIDQKHLTSFAKVTIYRIMQLYIDQIILPSSISQVEINIVATPYKIIIRIIHDEKLSRNEELHWELFQRIKSLNGEVLFNSKELKDGKSPRFVTRIELFPEESKSGDSLL